MASDNRDETAGTEKAVFWPGRCKQAQLGRRISGASADSLVPEKEGAWQI
jgi:hypothetical protein